MNRPTFHIDRVSIDSKEVHLQDFLGKGASDQMKVCIGRTEGQNFDNQINFFVCHYYRSMQKGRKASQQSFFAAADVPF